MNLANFVKGIEILRPHYSQPDGYHLGAEHDQFYMYATDTPLTEPELAELKSCGWFQPDSDDGPYDPADGWSAFV